MTWRYLTVHWKGGENFGWVVQPARKTYHGWQFGAVVAGPFKTKKEALQKKRDFYETSRDGCYSHTDCKDYDELAKECLHFRHSMWAMKRMRSILKRLGLLGYL